MTAAIRGAAFVGRRRVGRSSTGLRGFTACLLVPWLRCSAYEAPVGRAVLLWPIHFSSVPLSTPGTAALEAPEFGQELARIGLERYEAFVRQSLPRELSADPALEHAFRTLDHSRVNLAFQRWQQQAYATQEGTTVEELFPGTFFSPRLEGENYSWPELYNSREFAQLQVRISELSKLYLKRSRFSKTPPRFRIFAWVEVYKQGDALRPGAQADVALVMGRYFATVKKGSLKLHFEDPRGINPPYGKTFASSVYEGNLVMYPTWVSQLITPNMHNHTAVCYTFLVYPPREEKLEWYGDHSASLVVTRPLSAAPLAAVSPSS